MVPEADGVLALLGLCVAKSSSRHEVNSAVFYWCCQIKKNLRRRRRPKAGKDEGREKEGKEGRRKV